MEGLYSLFVNYNDGIDEIVVVEKVIDALIAAPDVIFKAIVNVFRLPSTIF